MTKPAYSRILLKLSGEALAGTQEYGTDPQTLKSLAQEIQEVHALGVQIALVIGGGNIFRGLAASSEGMDRANAGKTPCALALPDPAAHRPCGAGLSPAALPLV